MTINEMNKGRSGKYPKVLLAALIMTAMIFASVSLLFGPDNGNAGESTLGAPDLTVDIGRVEDAAQLGRIIGSAFADAVKGSEDDVEITVMVTGTNSFSDKLTIINPMLLEWLESDVYFTILWDADYTAAVAEDFAMELFGPGTLIITDGGSIELTSGYGEEYGPALNLSEVSLQVDDGTLNVNGDICSGNDANIYVSGGLRASGTLYISDSDSGIASIGYGAVAEVGGVSIEGWNASVAADEGGSIVILDSVTSVGLMTVITAHDGGSVEVGGDVTFSNVLSRINALNSGVVAIDGNVTMYGDIGISDDPSGLYADTYGLIEVGGDVLTEFGYTGIWADNGGTLIINGSVTAEDSYIRSWGGIMTICGVSGSVFIEAYDGEYITEGGTIAIEKDVTITGVSTWYTAGKYVIRVRGSGDLMIGGQAVVSADHVIISAGDSPRGLASPLSSGEGPLAHGIAIAGSLSMNNTARLETYGMSILIGGDVGMTGSYSSIFAYIGVIDIAGQVNMAGERSFIEANYEGTIEIGTGVVLSGEFSYICAYYYGTVGIGGTVTISGDGAETYEDPSGIFTESGGTVQIAGDVLMGDGYACIWADDGGTTIIGGGVTASDSYISSWSGSLTISGDVYGCVHIDANGNGIVDIEGSLTVTGIVYGSYGVIEAMGDGTVKVQNGVTVFADNAEIATKDEPTPTIAQGSEAPAPSNGTILINGDVVMKGERSQIMAMNGSIFVAGDVRMEGVRSAVIAIGGTVAISGDVVTEGDESSVAAIYGAAIFISGNVAMEGGKSMLMALRTDSRMYGEVFIMGSLTMSGSESSVWVSGVMVLGNVLMEADGTVNATGGGTLLIRGTLVADEDNYVLFYDIDSNAVPKKMSDGVLMTEGEYEGFFLYTDDDGTLGYDPSFVYILNPPALVFTNEGFGVPSGDIDTEIEEIDVSVAVSGGVAPYTFTIDGPDWLMITADGVISGTRSAASPAGTAIVKVTDDVGGTASMTITVGEVIGPPASISVGEQNGTITAGAGGTAAFIVTAENISDGVYMLSLANLPEGVTFTTLTIDGGTGILTLTGDASVTEGSHSLTLSMNGVTSETFELTIAPASTAGVTFTAVQTDGASRSADSTGLRITFDGPVTGLTADHITITDGTGAVIKGGLSGSGTTWTIAITVTTEGNVNVSVADFSGYEVTTDPQTVSVFKAASEPADGTDEIDMMTLAVIAVIVIASVVIVFLNQRKP